MPCVKAAETRTRLLVAKVFRSVDRHTMSQSLEQGLIGAGDGITGEARLRLSAAATLLVSVRAGCPIVLKCAAPLQEIDPRAFDCP